MPDVGENAAQEDIEVIKSLFSGGQDCIAVIVAGMGSGTGTGATPIVAGIAKEKAALTIAIACTPFDFEGPSKMQYAEAGLKKLCKSVDSIITLKNQGAMTVIDDLGLSGIDFKDAFKIIYNVPYKFVQLLSDFVYGDDDINGNVEFMKSVLKDSGDMFFDFCRRSTGHNILESIHDAARHVMELNPMRMVERFDGAGPDKCLLLINLGENISLDDETKKNPVI